MKRPPFFAFYPADFAGDLLVEAMTTAQVGAYILLLCKAWQADPPASLPNDDAVLARLARMTPGEWSEAKAGVLAPFRIGTDNRLHSYRLRQEYQKAVSTMKKRAKAGEIGAAARWHPDATANAVATGMPPGSHADETEIEIEREKKKDKDKEPPLPPKGGVVARTDDGFGRFWEAYPRRTARADAAKAFAKLAPDAALLDAMLAAVRDQQGPGGALEPRVTADGRSTVPYPATWLRGRRWEDEPPPATGPPAERRGLLSHDDRVLEQISDLFDPEEPP